MTSRFRRFRHRYSVSGLPKLESMDALPRFVSGCARQGDVATALRTREIGIRVALVARRGDISRAVLKGGIAVTGIGVAIGIISGIAAGRLLSSLLFGMPPYNAPILTVAVAALGASAFLANLLRARRASQVDPMTSLRAG